MIHPHILFQHQTSFKFQKKNTPKNNSYPIHIQFFFHISFFENLDKALVCLVAMQGQGPYSKGSGRHRGMTGGWSSRFGRCTLREVYHMSGSPLGFAEWVLQLQDTADLMGNNDQQQQQWYPNTPMTQFPQMPTAFQQATAPTPMPQMTPMTPMTQATGPMAPGPVQTHTTQPLLHPQFQNPPPVAPTVIQPQPLPVNTPTNMAPPANTASTPAPPANTASPPNMEPPTPAQDPKAPTPAKLTPQPPKYPPPAQAAAQDAPWRATGTAQIAQLRGELNKNLEEFAQLQTEHEQAIANYHSEELAFQQEAQAFTQELSDCVKHPLGRYLPICSMWFIHV